MPNKCLFLFLFEDALSASRIFQLLSCPKLQVLLTESQAVS